MFVTLRVTLSAFLGTGLLGGCAMGLADLVRKGVAIANSNTSDLQDEVTLEAWIGDDSHGKPQFATPIAIKAIVEKKQQLVRLSTGQEVQQQTKVTFLEPVTPNGAAERREPIDPRDRIVLPDSSTGPILGVVGMLDSGTHAPYMLEVSLGAWT